MMQYCSCNVKSIDDGHQKSQRQICTNIAITLCFLHTSLAGTPIIYYIVGITLNDMATDCRTPNITVAVNFFVTCFSTTYIPIFVSRRPVYQAMFSWAFKHLTTQNVCHTHIYFCDHAAKLNVCQVNIYSGTVSRNANYFVINVTNNNTVFSEWNKFWILNLISNLLFW